MAISRQVRGELEAEYGAIEEIEYSKPGAKEPSFIVVRSPRFSEYLLFSKYVENEGTEENPLFQIHDEMAMEYFTKVYIYPTNVPPSKLPVAVIFKACAISLSLSRFEDPETVRDMYIRSTKNVYTQIGGMLLKVISAFGVQGYLAARELKEHEIIDLVANIEAITDTHGEFAKLNNMQNIPFKHNGKINIEQLCGIKEGSDQSEGYKMDPAKKAKLVQYYKSMKKSDEEINSIISKIEESETNRTREVQPDKDGKIDINNMSEDQLKNLSKEDYNKLKEEGKILSLEESQKRTLEDTKDDLARKIAEDRDKYGSDKGASNKLGAKHFTGDLNTLLSQVKNKINTINLENE